MTKLGKSDLLRLLSILEGELEAQDIIIGELQVIVQVLYISVYKTTLKVKKQPLKIGVVLYNRYKSI